MPSFGTIFMHRPLARLLGALVAGQSRLDNSYRGELADDDKQFRSIFRPSGHVARGRNLARLGMPLAWALDPGGVYLYRVVNGYSKEPRGQIRYVVDRIEGDRASVSVTSDVSALGVPRTEIVTKEGNWLRRPLTNHDVPVDYEFAPALPAYVFPLAVGKTWSTRVSALNRATGRRNSVRIDGSVLATERVTVPAGSFDTIKIRRRIYAGDADGKRHETHIVEMEWYAPDLGRIVRSESTSQYMSPDACGDYYSCAPVLGDWNVFELVEVRRDTR